MSLFLKRRMRARRLQWFARAAQFPAVELLEQRQLLSAHPLTTSVVAFQQKAAVTSVTQSLPTVYTPAQIAAAYGFNQISFDNGAIKGNGAGQTIAIVDAYADPNIASDLQTFDAQFGLPAPPSLTQAIEQGATTNAGWAMETALDVEWAHAMAPAANILLVEANNSSLGSLLAAVNYARNQPGVSVVSMSWGSQEFAGEVEYDSYFTTPAGHSPITFVAASGDAEGTTWPSVSPNVLSVGGTTLTIGPVGNYIAETAWSDSGGGTSLFESEPVYQQTAQSTGARTTPDVAFDANPYTGYAVFDSVLNEGEAGWFDVGGTSAGAPQWSALIAIADQGRAASGESALGNAQAALYSLPASDFNDNVSASTGSPAATAYNEATGLGSPIANRIVQSLTASTDPAPQVVTPAQPSTQTANTGGKGNSGGNGGGQHPHSTPGILAALAVAPTTESSPISSDPAARLVAATISEPTAPQNTPAVFNVSPTANIAALEFTPAAMQEPTSTDGGVPEHSNLTAPLASSAAPLSVGTALGDSGWNESTANGTASRPAIDNSSGTNNSSDTNDSSESPLDSSDTDAYFSAGAWFNDATTVLSLPATSSSLTPASVVGVATALGTLRVWRNARRARKAIRKSDKEA